MPDKEQRSIERSKEANENFFTGIYHNFRLMVRLIKDPRVNLLLKFLPVGALIYLVVPLDFLPVNPIDDALVFWLGGALFIELCPDEVVQEHRDALEKVLSPESVPDESPQDVVEGEFKDVTPEDQ